jgi:hypothetical protein
MPDRFALPPEARPRDRQGRSWTCAQWVLLVAMGGLLLGVAGVLVWVVRVGLDSEPVDVLATVAAQPSPSPTPPPLVPDAVPTPTGLYMPPEPQPLAALVAPGEVRWWDARFAYRRRIEFDALAAAQPAGMWARVAFDGEGAQLEGKMRGDGADLRVVVWDGTQWWELPRTAVPRLEVRGWRIVFPLQDSSIAQQEGYYIYYGYAAASAPPIAQAAPELPRLLLSLGAEEDVEWGPEVAWTANSSAAQSLVSRDGRIVIECPAGGPGRDVRVRMRTVPPTEGGVPGPLPDFELHAQPAPMPLGSSHVVRWDPPLKVTINWAGLPVEVAEIEGWTRFVYDEDTNSWYSIPAEFDQRTGLLRFVTDQP